MQAWCQGLLLAALLMPLLPAQAQEAEPGGAAPMDFRALDQQAEALFDKFLVLGADVVAARHQSRHPVWGQLLVLGSVAPAENFHLETMQFSIDGESAASHRYSAAEIAALGQGGAQRLFEGDVMPGKRQLAVSWEGDAGSAEKPKRRLTWAFDSMGQRGVVEVHLAWNKKLARPEFTLRQWQ